jgi:hypothetical protein
MEGNVISTFQQATMKVFLCHSSISAKRSEEKTHPTTCLTEKHPAKATGVKSCSFEREFPFYLQEIEPALLFVFKQMVSF